jgi:anti-sigma-K factor RskA
MTLTPDDDGMAAEYALGTLDFAERATVAARRQREPDLDEAIQGWESRLAPLAEAIPPIPTARDFLADIEARIHRSTQGFAPTSIAPNASVIELRARLARWRAAAVGAASIAAMLAVGVVVRETTRGGAPHEFVAVLQKSPDAPAFAVTVNIDTREFTVRPVAAEAPAGKSYQLWMIQAKLGAPRSLGVIETTDLTHANKLAGIDANVVTDATYAVTVEPKGGSPTGQPTSAPIFFGKLIPVGP